MVKSNSANTKKTIDIVCQAAEDKQAIDLKVLDVRKTSNIVDFLIICSGESGPQLRAIEKEIDKKLRSNKIKGFRWQGLVSSGWLVLDLGSVVVHVMDQAARTYYDLDGLWAKEAVVFHY